MSRPNFNRRVDANQEAVIAKLRDLPGVEVLCLSGVGDGCPDFCVGFKERNYLVELKDESQPKSKQKLTDAEVKFKQDWTGQVQVCKNFGEVFKLITGQYI